MGTCVSIPVIRYFFKILQTVRFVAQKCVRNRIIPGDCDKLKRS